MMAVQSSTNAFHHFLSRQSAIRLGDPLFAVNPLWLYRVEPWALDRQRTSQDAHSCSACFDSSVVLVNPSAHFGATMPRGVVPNQRPYPKTQLRQLAAAPFQELGCDRADRTTIHEAQPDCFLHRCFWPTPAHQHAIAGQRFGISVLFLLDLLDQMERFIKPRSRHAVAAERSDSTTFHPRNPAPSRHARWHSRSDGRARFFIPVCRVRAADPLLGAFPMDPQP